jgi:phage FluMu protein Com
MPIKFACQHCDQVLSVSSSKVGKRAKCPKCQQSITIPTAEAAAEARARRKKAAPAGAEGSAEGDPFSQFVVYDDSEIVYETDEPEAHASDELTVDPNKISVPRSVLYAQGILLGVVALVCFVFGVIVGAATSSSGRVENALPTPCVITGRVVYASRGNVNTPDVGAVVIALPQNLTLTEKAAIGGLSPDDPAPDETHPSVLAIQNIGGSFSRTDENGQFKLRVADAGDYFILVLSKNVQRPAAADLNKTDLAQMGRYFTLTLDLLGNRQYRWIPERIKHDRTLSDVVF